MREWLRLAIPLLVVMANCAPATVELSGQERKENSMQQQAWDGKVDAERAGKVAVVLRVRLLAKEGGNKWDWDKVQLIGVIKNESHHEFPKEFRIAHYNHEGGVPDGESTVYLQRFNDADESLWKLLEGSAKTGVSHQSGGAPR